MMNALRRVGMRDGLVLAAFVLYAFATGTIRMPSVHYYYDAVGIRDAAVSWSGLSWDMGDKRRFLPAAVMGHVEGPLQFLILNGYAGIVGRFLPLSPRTMQFPNTVFVAATILLLYVLGRDLRSRRFGLVCAAVYVSMPWLGVCLRVPWYFNTLSCFLQALTLFSFFRLASDPEAKNWRIAAPSALSLYLLTGLDWPVFLPALGLFIVSSGLWRSALRNRWNILPAGVLCLHSGWTLALFLYAKNNAGIPSDAYLKTILLHPFSKVSGQSAGFNAGLIVDYFWRTGGAPLLSGWAGAATAVRFLSKRFRSDAGRSEWFLVSMAAWLIAASVPLLKASSSETYGYVIGVPAALCAAAALSSARPVFLAALLMASAAGQWCSILDSRMAPVSPESEDVRVPAIAAFLNEKRPDLLSIGKTALLPRDLPSNVGQYARGRNGRLIVPVDYPATRTITSFTSTEPGRLAALIEECEAGALPIDWLILHDDLLSGRLASSTFYRSLLNDKRIDWIAAFPSKEGRTAWVGEKRGGGTAYRAAVVQDTDAWALKYSEHHDRLPFLSQNTRFIDHY